MTIFTSTENVNKAINDNIYTWGFLMGPTPMELYGG
jgi:hypothetical protein